LTWCEEENSLQHHSRPNTHIHGLIDLQVSIMDSPTEWPAEEWIASSVFCFLPGDELLRLAATVCKRWQVLLPHHVTILHTRPPANVSYKSFYALAYRTPWRVKDDGLDEFRCLPLLSRLAVLALPGAAIGLARAATLASGLRNSPLLTSLDVSCNALRSAGVSLIAAGLQSGVAALRVLNIAENQLLRGALALCGTTGERFVVRPHGEHPDQPACERESWYATDETGLRALCGEGGVCLRAGFESLDLSLNAGQARHGPLLAEACAGLLRSPGVGLQSLRVADCALGGVLWSGEGLAKGLRVSRMMRRTFAGASLAREGLQRFGEALGSCASLTALDVSGGSNELDPEGAALLARAVGCSPALRRLTIGSTAGAATIVAAAPDGVVSGLRPPASLAECDLSLSTLRVAHAAVLAAFVPRCRALRALLLPPDFPSEGGHLAAVQAAGAAAGFSVRVVRHVNPQL
jgi:hypothetical protein